jgi:hypothetical protein
VPEILKRKGALFSVVAISVGTGFGPPEPRGVVLLVINQSVPVRVCSRQMIFGLQDGLLGAFLGLLFG